MIIDINSNPTEERLRSVASELQNVGKYLNASADSLNQAFGAFWGGTKEEAQAVLDRLGPEQVQRIFGLHAKAAIYLNELLESMDQTQFANRVNTDRRFDVTFEDGKFLVRDKT